MLYGLFSGLAFLAYVVLAYSFKWMDEAFDEVDKTVYEDQRKKAQHTTTMTDPEGTQIIIKRKRRIRTK